MVRVFLTTVSCAIAASLRQQSAVLNAALELDREGFWPFTSEEPAPAAKATVAAAPEHKKTVAEAKQSLLASKVFQEKTAQLCAPAKSDINEECHKIAQDRLFCTMFTRHLQQFNGMDGVAEQKDECSKVDIMLTVVDAAKDMKEKEDAALENNA